MPSVRPDRHRPERHSTPTRLHPADARAYWMAAKIPSDQFLLYCFDQGPEDLDAEVLRLLERSACIEVLGRHITNAPARLDYPRWTAASPRTDAISIDRKPHTWLECLDAIASAFDHQVDPRISVWHLHLYPNVIDAPGGAGPAVVAVLQLSHAAADGSLAAQTARDLLGTHRLPPVPTYGPRSTAAEVASVSRAAATLPLHVASMIRGGLRARRDADSLGHATDSGSIPPPAHSRALTVLDVAPTGRTSIRTIVLPKADLQSSGTTVTTFAMTAISVALQRFLGGSSDLAAEVTLARDARGVRGTTSATSASGCTSKNRIFSLAVGWSRPI